jgi:hypothetical protein
MVEAANRAFIVHGLQPFYEVSCSAAAPVAGHMRCQQGSRMQWGPAAKLKPAGLLYCYSALVA